MTSWMLLLEDCWLDFLVDDVVLVFLCEDNEEEGEDGAGDVTADGLIEEAEISGADEVNILCAPLERGEIGARGSCRQPRSLNKISAS